MTNLKARPVELAVYTVSKGWRCWRSEGSFTERNFALCERRNLLVPSPAMVADATTCCMQDIQHRDVWFRGPASHKKSDSSCRVAQYLVFAIKWLVISIPVVIFASELIDYLRVLNINRLAVRVSSRSQAFSRQPDRYWGISVPLVKLFRCCPVTWPMQTDVNIRYRCTWHLARAEIPVTVSFIAPTHQGYDIACVIPHLYQQW